MFLNWTKIKLWTEHDGKGTLEKPVGGWILQRVAAFHLFFAAFPESGIQIFYKPLGCYENARPMLAFSQHPRGLSKHGDRFRPVDAKNK